MQAVGASAYMTTLDAHFRALTFRNAREHTRRTNGRILVRHTDVHLVERNGTIQNWFEMHQPTDQARMCLNSRQPIRLNIQRLVVKTEEISLQDKDRQPQRLTSAYESTYLEYSGGRSGRSLFTLFLSTLCLLAIGCANADSVSEASGNTVDALVSTGIDAGVIEVDALTTIEDAATPQLTLNLSQSQSQSQNHPARVPS